MNTSTLTSHRPDALNLEPRVPAVEALGDRRRRLGRSTIAFHPDWDQASAACASGVESECSGAHIQGMDPLRKGMCVLRVAIAEASNNNSVVAAERALDGYLASFPSGSLKTGALTILQDTLRPHWRSATGDRRNYPAAAVIF